MTEPGHNSRATTLREAAKFILACDQEVADVNERKKEYYKDLKRDVGENDIAALKDAIKLHRKRLKQEDVEGHDTRVWEVLGFIEDTNGQPAQEIAPRATVAPAKGHPDKLAPTRNARPLPPHDPSTGEIIEPEPGAAFRGATAPAAETVSIPVTGTTVSAIPHDDDPNPMPVMLKRSA